MKLNLSKFLHESGGAQEAFPLGKKPLAFDGGRERDTHLGLKLWLLVDDHVLVDGPMCMWITVPIGYRGERERVCVCTERDMELAGEHGKC